MKSREKSKSKVELEIIKSLLSGEKTTGQIAKELGYVEKNGIPSYKNVEPYLMKLKRKGILKSEKKKAGPGRPATAWRINLTSDVLKRLVEDYPECIPYMQKNEKIIEFIIEKCITLEKLEEWYEKDRSNIINEGLGHVAYLKIRKHIMVEEVKRMLQSSPNFFKMLATRTLNELKDIYEQFPENSLVKSHNLFEVLFTISAWKDLESNNVGAIKNLERLKKIEGKIREIIKASSSKEVYKKIYEVLKEYGEEELEKQAKKIWRESWKTWCDIIYY